ncbi:MAG: hypothetical protein ACKVRP_02520, partial [Bacteroidota bacterium]
MNKSCRYLLLEILIGLAILASDGSGQNIVVLRHESVPSLDTNVHVRNILRNIISGQTFEALSDSTTGVSQLNNIPPGNYQLTTLQRDHFLKIQDTLEVTGNID